MKKIVYICVLFASCFLFAQCYQPEDIYTRFSPEILYKRYVQTTTGWQWQVSPDAISVTLGDSTNFTVYARVSAPNKLKTITVYEVVNEKENMVTQYNQSDGTFTLGPTVYQLAYPFTNITSTKLVRTKAEDMIGNITIRDFTINK